MRQRYRIEAVLQLFAIIALSVLATWLFLTPRFFFFGFPVAAICISVIIFFLRYLDQSKTDLKQFLLSFREGDFDFKGTNRMLRHSKDDLNIAYHQLMQSLEKWMEEKGRDLQMTRNLLDHLNVGIIAVNRHGDFLFTNRFTRNLLHNPDLKNLYGLKRMSNELAGTMEKMNDHETANVRLLVEDETREFLIHAHSMSFMKEEIKVYTLENIKKEVRTSELEAWGRLLEVISGQLKKNENKLPEGLALFNKKMKYKTEKIYISALFDKCLKNTSPLFPEPHESLIVRLSNNDLWIEADENAMLMVLEELIRNAVEAVEENTIPLVELAAELDLSCKVQIIVKDQGKGIEPEKLVWVTVPFFSTKKGQYGLGLSMARRCMEEMNGTIDIQSQPGEGTTVYLRFY